MASGQKDLPVEQDNQSAVDSASERKRLPNEQALPSDHERQLGSPI